MKHTLLTAAVVSLAGCHSFNGLTSADTHCNSKASCSSDIHTEQQQYNQQPVLATTASQQEPQYVINAPYQYAGSVNSHKLLADYAGQMSMQLFDTLNGFSPDARVAVASFVDLGSDLQASNVVGNQLAESFVHQMQQYGIAMVDYKTSKGIRVTSQGDFVFSRQHQHLDTLQIIDYVLSGTMLHTPNGILVNARVINFRSKVVAASSQQLIPHFVISAL